MVLMLHFFGIFFSASCREIIQSYVKIVMQQNAAKTIEESMEILTICPYMGKKALVLFFSAVLSE